MKSKSKPESKEKLKFWRTLIPYIGDYKGNVILAMILSMITGLCVAIQPFVISYILDSGILGKDLVLLGFRLTVEGTGVDFRIKLVLILCGGYLLCSALRIFVWQLGLNNMIKMLEGTLFSLRSKFFVHVQQMCMRFYDNNSSGELYNYIMGSPMNNIKGYLNSMLMTVPYQAVSLVISLVMLFSYSPILTAVTVLTSAGMALFYKFSRGKIRNLTKDYLHAESEASRYINDVLHGSEAVKMYSIEDETIDKFHHYANELRSKGINYSFSSAVEYQKLELVQYIGIAVVYAVGAYLCIVPGTLSVGQLTAFLASMTTILGTFSSWLNIGLQKNSAMIALDRVQSIIEQMTDTPEATEEKRMDVEEEKRSAIEGGFPCIEYDNVTFAYREKKIFEHFNCVINYNESIGLVGSSGSGKSTFTKLIMRLYDPDEGKVRVHGRNVKNFPTREIRRSFGVVPQNPFIFYGTVWDNIRIVAPDATDEEIRKAISIARVDEFVSDLPKGYDTVIGDGAMDLSGGQKQRIAIARAVLKKPDIFIFDEATSALDNISERLIQEAIEELMKTHTFIIVAHRLSTIRNVDRILVFDHGRIIQEGNYKKLEAEEGEFKKLVEASEFERTVKPVLI